MKCLSPITRQCYLEVMCPAVAKVLKALLLRTLTVANRPSMLHLSVYLPFPAPGITVKLLLKKRKTDIQFFCFFSMLFLYEIIWNEKLLFFFAIPELSFPWPSADTIYFSLCIWKLDYMSLRLHSFPIFLTCRRKLKKF